MSAVAPLYVTAAGAVTSVGLSLPATAAAIRAAVDNFQETHFSDQDHNPLLGAAVALPMPADGDGSRTGGAERFGAMLAMAIEECVASSGLPLPLPAGVPLLLLADDTRPGPLKNTAHTAYARCAHFFAEPQSLHMQAFTSGESACIAALAAAREFIANGAPAVLIAAVDSWLNVMDVGTGVRQDRFLSDSQAAGFVPGEAAAAILLQAQSRDGAAALQLRGLGLAEEPAGFFGEDACHGKGLAAAMRLALAEAGLQAHEMDSRLCDAAGEDYFFEESAYAWGRVLRDDLPAAYEYLQPATRIGHIGAAFGPLLVGYLWQLSKVGRLRGPNALVHLSSTQSLRGALVLSQRSNQP